VDAEPIPHPQIGAHVRIHGNRPQRVLHGNDGMRPVRQGVRQRDSLLRRRLEEAWDAKTCGPLIGLATRHPPRQNDRSPRTDIDLIRVFQSYLGTVLRSFCLTLGA
jgi:hypothetical protein